MSDDSRTARIKEIAQKRISEFLLQLNPVDDGKQDDNDGIYTRTADKLHVEERARRRLLSQHYVAGKSLFSDEDRQADEIVAAVPLEETDINRRLKWGYTPLIQAAIDGNYAECERLLRAGADPTIKDNSDKTAWEKAKAMGRSRRLIRLLKPKKGNKI